MSKVTDEEKLAAIMRVEEGMSMRKSAKMAGVHNSMVQKWVGQYRERGVEGIVKKEARKHYSGEFKLYVVEYAHANHLSATAATSYFELSSKSMFLGWERRYYEEGPQGLMQDRRGRVPKAGTGVGRKKQLDEATKEDLIAEIQQLRMENEYLKKLQALVRERQQGQKS